MTQTFLTSDKHFLIHHNIFPQTSFSTEMIPQGRPAEKKRPEKAKRDERGTERQALFESTETGEQHKWKQQFSHAEFGQGLEEKTGKEGKKEKSEYLSPHPLGQLAEH